MKKFLNKLDDKISGGGNGNAGGGGGGGGSTGPSDPVGAPVQIPDLNAGLSPRLLYTHRKQFGVNLGSWFTLEKWLTGSVFQGNDPKAEHDILSSLGPEKARGVLEGHWDGFINDGDWQWMVSHGINTVRIPVSYYHFLPGHPDHSVQRLMDGTEFEKYAAAYTGAWQRVVQAIQTAGSHGIGVLVDLHAAPGAQNTDGHSGLSTGKAGLWEGMSSSKNQKRTIAILEALATEVAKFDNVVGLELLNEPKNNGGLEGFYKDAIKAIRKRGPAEAALPLYLGDAWDLNHYSEWVSHQANAHNFLVVDHHLYRCFTPQDHSKSASDHANAVRPGGNGGTYNMLKGASGKLGGSLIIGEWSSALNPKSLKGGGGQQEWGQAQIAAYSALIGGNFFWTLKKEGPSDGGWNLYSAVEKGNIPGNLGRPSNIPGDLPQRRDQSHQQAFGSHCDYWNSHGGKGDHAAFSQGFQQGWGDCERFWNEGNQSLIGFKKQWALLRVEAWRQGPGSDKKGQEWEFEHGCAQAIDAFNGAVLGA